MSGQTQILVIDDSKVTRSLICAQLSEGGYTPVECDNGETAAERYSDDISLVILDITMPGLDGFGTCRAIRMIQDAHGSADIPPVPIILISGKNDMETRARGFLSGATEFINKSDVREHLMTVVNKILKPNARFAGMKAVVADDSATARKLLIHALQDEGLQVTDFENGALAFKHLEEHHDLYDIILSDVVMPEMDGLELCTHVRVNLGRKDIPIIILTSSESQHTLRKAFESGATDYLNKPYTHEELLARISSHLDALHRRRNLKTAIDQLEDMNSSMNRILAACSHDLKAPLSAINGYTELILDEYGDQSEELRNDLKAILRCVAVQVELIDDIMSLTKLEHTREDLEMDFISLNDLLSNALPPLKKMADIKEIQLDCSLESHSEVYGNSTALLRVFNNLVSNAIKFTPKSGSISIRLRETDGGFIELSVKDTGIGIPEDKQSSIFDPFTSASRRGTDGESTTGLGLSICSKITEIHGGTIDLESIENQGSTFSITLPIAKEHQGQKAS